MKVNIVDRNISFQTNIRLTKSFYKILKDNPSKMSEYRLYADMLGNNAKNDVLILSSAAEGNKQYIQAHVCDVREKVLYSGCSSQKNIADKDTCNGMFLPNIIELYEQAYKNIKLSGSDAIEQMRKILQN